ncbi:hypothetical protein AMECASPLE_030504 [Ameca splendens]|uniref:Uncharacterized protein n=1 Tax=Ameca splendens TaxID=208324 RepID=A0ABV0YHI1_9TELE
MGSDPEVRGFFSLLGFCPQEFGGAQSQCWGLVSPGRWFSLLWVSLAPGECSWKRSRAEGEQSSLQVSLRSLETSHCQLEMTSEEIFLRRVSQSLCLEADWILESGLGGNLKGGHEKVSNSDSLHREELRLAS